MHGFLRKTSNYFSLSTLISPRLRQQYEAYIRQQAINSSYKALTLENMQEVSDLTLSNLFWYFKNCQ
jgi:hypothetical protein